MSYNTYRGIIRKYMLEHTDLANPQREERKPHFVNQMGVSQYSQVKIEMLPC